MTIPNVLPFENPIGPRHHMSPAGSQSQEEIPGDREIHQLISVGADQELLYLEALLSETNLVILSITPEEAVFYARTPPRRVWVLGYTIAISEVVRIASSVRRYSPESRLLLLAGVRQPGHEASLFDCILGGADEEILDAIRDLAESPSRHEESTPP